MVASEWTQGMGGPPESISCVGTVRILYGYFIRTFMVYCTVLGTVLGAVGTFYTCTTVLVLQYLIRKRQMGTMYCVLT